VKSRWIYADESSKCERSSFNEWTRQSSLLFKNEPGLFLLLHMCSGRPNVNGTRNSARRKEKKLATVHSLVFDILSLRLIAVPVMDKNTAISKWRTAGWRRGNSFGF